MSTMRWLYRSVRHQARNARRVLRGKQVCFPSFGAMTLDMDDVDLAAWWLKHPDAWHDDQPVHEFETRFARWNGSRHTFAFMSGRVALSACIHALRLKPGDEVIVPGYTCVVVPNAFRFAGIRVVFSDIELDTFGLDADILRQRITPATRAILVHHLYGFVCRDYEAILHVAADRGLRVIEDCSQATGASYRGLKLGNRGDVAFYSAEISKVFTTIQGGVATTNDPDLAARLEACKNNAENMHVERIRKLLNNVPLHYYLFKHPHRWLMADLAERRFGKMLLMSTTKEELEGVKPAYYGVRLPAPLAAIGKNQLKKIHRYETERARTAQKWDRWCESAGYRKPTILPDSKPAFLRYPVMVEPEKKSDPGWAEEPLRVRPGVWFSSNQHPSDLAVEECPASDEAVARCINLPTLGVLP